MLLLSGLYLDSRPYHPLRNRASLFPSPFRLSVSPGAHHCNYAQAGLRCWSRVEFRKKFGYRVGVHVTHLLIHQHSRVSAPSRGRSVQSMTVFPLCAVAAACSLRTETKYDYALIPNELRWMRRDHAESGEEEASFMFLLLCLCFAIYRHSLHGLGFRPKCSLSSGLKYTQGNSLNFTNAGHRRDRSLSCGTFPSLR